MTPNNKQLISGLFSTIIVVLAFWIVHGFLPALAWAVILAVSSWPLYRRFERSLQRRIGSMTTAALFTLLVAVVFIAPLIVIFVKISVEGQLLAKQLLVAEQSGLPAPYWLGNVPGIGKWLLDQWNTVLGTPGGIADWVKHSSHGSLFGWAKSLGQQVLQRSFVLAFTLLALFFLYRDGHPLAQAVTKLVSARLGKRGQDYLQHSVLAIRATVNGLVLVGLGEGLLVGIGYALASVPTPAVWGALTGFLAMIPFAAPLVFGAAALLLFAQGATIAAMAILAWGMLVLFVADHIVRPMLIGGAIRLPFLWVLLGILGGLETIGLLGVFLGPVVMALAMTLWREWIRVDAEGSVKDAEV